MELCVRKRYLSPFDQYGEMAITTVTESSIGD